MSLLQCIGWRKKRRAVQPSSSGNNTVLFTQIDQERHDLRIDTNNLPDNVQRICSCD